MHLHFSGIGCLVSLVYKQACFPQRGKSFLHFKAMEFAH